MWWFYRSTSRLCPVPPQPSSPNGPRPPVTSVPHDTRFSTRANMWTEKKRQNKKQPERKLKKDNRSFKDKEPQHFCMNSQLRTSSRKPSKSQASAVSQRTPLHVAFWSSVSRRSPPQWLSAAFFMILYALQPISDGLQPNSYLFACLFETFRQL